MLLTRPLLNNTLPAQFDVDIGNDTFLLLSIASELKKLKAHDEKLQSMLSNFSLETAAIQDHIKNAVMLEGVRFFSPSINNSSKINSKHQQGPSRDYEERRRAIYREIQEMWYYNKQELGKLKSNNQSSSSVKIIQDLINSWKEQKE